MYLFTLCLSVKPNINLYIGVLRENMRQIKHSSYRLHPVFNEKSKNHCAQLQCISSTLYSLSQSIAWLQSGELRIAEILQTDGHQVFEQRA
jgi:hypothetical protein